MDDILCSVVRPLREKEARRPGQARGGSLPDLGPAVPTAYCCFGSRTRCDISRMVLSLKGSLGTIRSKKAQRRFAAASSLERQPGELIRLHRVFGIVLIPG